MENLKEIACELEDIVRKLAFPRFSGTPDIEKAENIIIKECERRTINPKIESFKTSDFFMVHINKIPYFLIGVYVVILSILMITNINQYLAFILGVCLLIFSFSIEGFIRMLKYPSMYSKFAKIHESHNIILNTDYESNNLNKTNIFILAHIDSKSEKPKPNPLFLVIYLSVQMGSIIFSIHIVVFALYQIVSQGAFLHGTWIFSYGLAFGFIDMLRILTKYYPGDSFGANDDAIGVGICLILQKYFNESEHKLKNVNICCILTGSEELGEAGAYNFLKSKINYLKPEKNHFLILDGLSGNTIYYFPSYGVKRRPFSLLFLNAIESLIKQNYDSTKNLKFIRMWMPPPVNTDHSPIVKLNYPAFVFASPEKVSHTKEDTPEKIDYEGVAEFYLCLIDILKYIDSNPNF